MTTKRGTALLGRLVRLARAVAIIERADPDAGAEGLEVQDLLDSAALVQDLRRRLSDVELALVAEVGRRAGKTVASLSDGRQATVSRSGDRTAWDHEDWKRDVRREVTHAATDRFGVAGDLYDMKTGEQTSLAVVVQTVLAQAQEVHGSTAPRTTALKRLGLYAGDYSTTTPGPWRLQVVAPTSTTEPTTTTQEK